MGDIEIRFRPMFKEPILTGVKVCTSRTKRMGKPGDTFLAFGERFELIDIEPETLGRIKDHLWKEEGAKSPEHFEEIWTSIHPGAGFVPDQRVYLHWFRRHA